MLDYAVKADTAGEMEASILGQTKNFTLSAVTDIATTLWNSIPFTPKADTEDVLRRIDEDAANFYIENPDAVHLTSLIGGAIVPGGVTLKLLNRYRAGIGSVGFGKAESLVGGSFSGSRQKMLSSEIESAFRTGGTATKEYKALTRQLYTANAVQQVADNAVIELAVVGAMNAHPYMEDYTDNFAKNYAIGVVAGGALGSLFSLGASSKQLRNLVGPIEVKGAIDILDSGYKPVQPGLTAAGQIIKHTENIKILEALVVREDLDTYTRSWAADILRQEGGRRQSIVESAFPSYAKSSDDVKKIVGNILEDPTFEGVDRIRLVDLDKIEKFATSQQIQVLEPANSPLALKLTEAAMAFQPGKSAQKATGFQSPTMLTPEGKAAVVFYRPSTGEVFAAEGARNAASAADITDVTTKLRATSESLQRTFAVPHLGFVEEDSLLRGISTANSDFRYLAELHAVDKMDLTKLPHVAVGPEDLPRMQALISKMAKLPDDQRNSIKVTITEDQPMYSAQMKVLKQIVDDERILPPGYYNKVKQVTDDRSINFLGQGISKDAEELLGYWIHGIFEGKRATAVFGMPGNRTGYANPDIAAGIAATRRAFDAFFRGTAVPKGEEKWVKVAEEIYNKGAAYRAELRKLADAEGNIILFRGIKASQPKGQSAVESYSASYEVAKGFAGRNGKVIIAPVKVDDVIGTVGSGDMNEAEILVAASAQQSLESLPKTGIKKAKGQLTEHLETITEEANAIPGRVQVPLADLPKHYFDAVTGAARTLLGNGFSLEETAARLNLQKDALASILTGGNIDNWNSFRYTDASKISEYLNEQNRLYALVGNPRKNPVASATSNLDRRQLDIANKEIMDQFTLLSNSTIAKDIANIYEADGAKLALQKLSDEVVTIVNSKVGNFRWQSADQMLRDLEVGPLIVGLSKRFVDTLDQTKQRLLTPVAAAAQNLKTSAIALAEFNDVYNQLAGLRGFRDLMKLADDKYYIVQQGKDGFVPVTGRDGKPLEVRSQPVIDLLEATRKVSGDLYSLHNLNRTITGRKPLTDLGLYLPPLSLVGKNVSFVIDTTGQKQTQLLVANSADELASLEQAWRKANAAELNRYDLVSQGRREDYNRWKQYWDANGHGLDTNITYANVALEHRGSTMQAITPSGYSLVENMMQSYENVITQSSRQYHELYLHDTMYWLDELSTFYHKYTAEQPKYGLFKEKPVKDAALTVKNLLLGRDQLEQSIGLKATNSYYDFMINRAVQLVDNTIKLPEMRKHATKEYFDKLGEEYSKTGMTMPWKTFDEYLATISSDARNVAPIIQSVGNGLLATLNLRMFEVAQAAVNIMSLPILTWSALMEKLPATVVGDTMSGGNAMKFPLRVMYDGIRHMNSVEGKKLSELWEKQGMIKQAVRQYTELTSEIKSAYRGGRFSDRAIELATKAQENPLVKNFLARPADWVEEMTRKVAMHTGYVAAKQAYPGIDDFGATIAAMNFADRSIGNYHAAQRPGLFQGTFGSAIGLYQTYMLTYFQSIYRGIEERNFRQLAALALAQTGVFGIASWPGFNMLSEQIVANFNNDHWDITTGTYRAVAEPMAEMILYGLPSSLGPAFYTRGDVSPRIPSSVDNLAIFNGIKQGWNAASEIVTRTSAGIQNGNPMQSLMEALSLQSLNRPIARWAELAAGESITTQGNTVSPAAEVWSPVGIYSRLLGTRPLEEQKVRNTVYLNKFYEQIDFERRQAAVEKLKTSLRSGNLDNSLVAETAMQYLKNGGTAQGWTSAMNEILLKTEEGTRYDLLRKLEPESPLRVMIQDLF